MMRKIAIILFTLLSFQHLFSQSDSSISFCMEYVLSPINHFVKKGTDKQNIGTGIFLSANFDNVLEFRSGFIYDFEKYSARYKYYSYIPPTFGGTGRPTYFDTTYIFNVVRVPFTMGIIFSSKKKINTILNLGFQLNMTYENGKINKVVNYRYEDALAFYYGCVFKYIHKKKLTYKAEISQFMFKKTEEYRSHFSSKTYSGLDSKFSLSLILGISYCFATIPERFYR